MLDPEESSDVEDELRNYEDLTEQEKKILDDLVGACKKGCVSSNDTLVLCFSFVDA